MAIEAKPGNRFPVKSDGMDYGFMTCSAPRKIGSNVLNVGCPVYQMCRLPTKGKHKKEECSPGCDGGAHPVWIFVTDKIRDKGSVRFFHCAQWYNEIRDDQDRYRRIPYSVIKGKGIGRVVGTVVKNEFGEKKLVQKMVMMREPAEAILGDEANDSYRPSIAASAQFDLLKATLPGEDEQRAWDERYGPTPEESVEAGGSFPEVETTLTKGPQAHAMIPKGNLRIPGE
jgi:hypothetical protein